MKNAPRKPITTKVIRDGTDLVLYAYAGKRKIGHLQVFRVKHPRELNYKCQADLKRIQGSRPGITVYMAWKAHVSERYRRRGAGVALYEAALAHVRAKHAPAAVALVPMECQSYGCTSESAKRVWRTLARRRKGTHRAILANPTRTEELAELVQLSPALFAVGGSAPGTLIACGANGCVFKAGRGRVIKVSFDDGEAKLAAWLAGPRKEPFLPRFYAGRTIPGPEVGLDPVFQIGVLLREDLRDFPMPTKGLYDEAVNEMLGGVRVGEVLARYKGHLSIKERRALAAISSLLSWSEASGINFERREFSWEDDPDWQKGDKVLLPNAVSNMGVTARGAVVVRDLGNFQTKRSWRRNPDVDLRNLERQAAAGDDRARRRLCYERIRRKARRPFSSPWSGGRWVGSDPDRLSGQDVSLWSWTPPGGGRHHLAWGADGSIRIGPDESYLVEIPMNPLYDRLLKTWREPEAQCMEDVWRKPWPWDGRRAFKVTEDTEENDDYWERLYAFEHDLQDVLDLSFCMDPDWWSQQGGGGHQCASPDVATCGNCDRSWCDRCDPTPAALCPFCHGRGESDAEVL